VTEADLREHFWVEVILAASIVFLVAVCVYVEGHALWRVSSALGPLGMAWTWLAMPDGARREVSAVDEAG
jgi:hypothetical protein